jgi:asparagine synthase (glutamine-hydrolysing)
MCGICGFVGWYDETALKSMTSIMAHRGPDDEGFYISREDLVGLGNRRLAIQDLSSDGHMPMCDNTKRYWITFNGEIYNFQNLRATLGGKGYVFHSRSDTEVILAAYCEYGKGCLQYFNGMFAFAIWDTVEKELFIARDRVGEKPLYYYYKDRKLIFASEIKSLLSSNYYKPQINPKALYQYLRLQYVRWPYTMFDGIMKLPPAHYLTYKDGQISIHRYWKPTIHELENDEKELSTEFYNLLDDAVSLRLISDAPIGLFLSGGVDSSAIATLASKKIQNLQSYTVGFPDGNSFDESYRSKEIADSLSIRNQVIECNNEGLSNNIVRLLWHLEEPIAETLIYPYFALSSQARKTFTVALSGEGADELLYGYRYYQLETIRLKLDNFVRHIPKESLLKFINHHDISSNRNLLSLNYMLASNPVDAMIAWNASNFSDYQVKRLLQQEYYAPFDLSNCLTADLFQMQNNDERDIAPIMDFQLRMVDYILTVRDKMTMAFGLEMRTPFLDHRLVEFCMSLPYRMKTQNFRNKWNLRESLKQILPSQVANRAKKPFGAPIAYWIKTLYDRYMKESLLCRDGVVNKQELMSWSKFSPDNVSMSPVKLWSLIVLEIWYRIFITRTENIF